LFKESVFEMDNSYLNAFPFNIRVSSELTSTTMASALATADWQTKKGFCQNN